MSFAVHVVYHANRKTELLRDCLVPLAAEVAALPGVARCYLDRQWRFGPHVRICVRATDPAAEDAVAALAVPRVRAYLAAHPSTHVLDPVAYVALSERLGTVELVPPPYAPLWDDNTCFIAPYEPRADLLGPPAAVDFYERLQTRAVEPIRALLAASHGPDSRRFDYVLQLLVMLAATYPGGMFSGQLSYRSHLEEFLFEHDGSGAVRAVFAQRFAAMREPVIARVRGVAESLVDLASVTPRRIPYELERLGQRVYRGPDPVLRQWSDLFEWGWTEALPLADSGALTEEPGARHREVAAAVNQRALARWTVTDDRTWSPFHTRLRQLNTEPEFVRLLEFSSFRWLVNTFYVLLQVLDVTPKDRYFLQYLAVHAIEAITGRTWREQIDQALRERGLVA